MGTCKRKRTKQISAKSHYTHLEPSFSVENGTFYVEFKIGVSKMYMLKDVFAFEDALSNQENYKYGKNLQFVHTEESFDEESRPIVKFLRKWTANNRAFHRQRTYYGYYTGAVEKLRYVDLSGDDIAEFLQLLENKTLKMFQPFVKNFYR